MKNGDKFKHKSGVIYTLCNLISMSYETDCWILVSQDNKNGKHRQWCAVDEGDTAMGAFGGHFKDFEKV